MKKTLDDVFHIYMNIGYYEGRLVELEIQTAHRGYTKSEEQDYDDYMRLGEQIRKELKKYDYLKTQEVEE